MTTTKKPFRPRFTGKLAASHRNEPTPVNCPFTAEQIAQLNAQHDRRHGFRDGHYTRWDETIPRLHGPAHLNKNLPIRERDRLVWAQHNRSIAPQS